uniref:Signal transduction protein n=1 Tax=uncultured Bacteroidota bacterium TaxID=152509 RepID=H5SNW2_9BACT|nr:signal transduction protein [uncultured Bacteroidetes bacterium]
MPDLHQLLEEELSQAEIHLFERAEEGLAYLEKSILEGKELFLFLAPVPQGEAFLTEALHRWPLAYGLGLTREAELLSLKKPFLTAYLNSHVHSLRPYLRELAQRYTERRQSEEQRKTLLEIHRVSLSLTGEVRLEWLVFKLLRISLDNSGAEEGFLIVPDPSDPSRLRVAGYAHAHQHEPYPYETKPIAEETRLFAPLIEYAARARENVLIEETDTSLWVRHPEWLRTHLKGVLVLPLIYQGRLLGLVYLANTTRPLELPPDKMELLKLFTAPAAIALQNAQLYAEMEERVRERTAEVIRQKEEIERQSLLLRQQNEDILASLRYAQRVQRAIFPPWSELRKAFPESFLFYLPREIVGGDFYWFAQRLSKAIVAVGDCTGHGIPGAFMTVIANTLLKQIVEMEGVFKPAEILYLLNLRMRAALQHEDQAYERFREGLELGLVQIDPRRYKLLYAGANRPLFFVRQGRGTEIRPDRITLGTPYEGEAPEFTLHTLDLQPGDMIYLFSDGFTDQLNSEGKRYQLRKFYEFLELIADQPPAQQALLLEAELQRWSQTARQTDDILVLGIRIR